MYRETRYSLRTQRHRMKPITLFLHSGYNHIFLSLHTVVIHNKRVDEVLSVSADILDTSDI